MKWLNLVRDRLRGLLRREAVLQDIDEELRSHVEMETHTNIERGMMPDEARLAALGSFGDIGRARELVYEVRGGGMLETLWQDLCFGVRMLLKKPGFTLIALLTLALGIGANTAIFSVVNAVLLRPLPYTDPERLVQVWEHSRPKNDPRHSVAPANYLDWRAQNRVFERIAAVDPSPSFNLTGAEGPERVRAARVSADLFPLLGVTPSLGRSFLTEEEQPGRDRVVVVSHGLWQRRYGSDPRLIGQPLSLNGQSFTVVGVLPPDFHPPQGEFELAVPLALEAWEAAARGTHPLLVYAKLKTGVTLSQAQEEMGAVARRLEQQYPETNSGKAVTLVSLHEQLTGHIGLALWVLLGAVGFVLLIACANVANLLLARSLARHKEFAVRLALGAGRWRLVRQLLTESLLLAGAGGLAGLLLAVWAVQIIVAFLAGADLIPQWAKIGVDSRALIFMLATTLVTGMVFGLAPALTAMRADLNEALKEGGRKSTQGKRDRRLRHALVVSEIAMAMMLLVGAGLMIQSFWRLLKVDPGFQPEKVLTVELSLPTTRYPQPHQVSQFYDRLLQRIGSLPGVRSAGGAAYLPFSGARNSWAFDIEGRPPLPADRAEAEWRPITAGYFRTMGIPLAAGRDFTEQDGEDRPGVVIINEAMARLYWPGEDPLGRRLQLHDARRKDAWHTVVGVVKDVRHLGPASEPKPEMYFPYPQLIYPWYPMNVVISTDSDPAQLVPVVRQAVLDLDKELPVYNVRTMEELLAKSVAQNRLNMVLFGAFAGVALTLAAVGLYGVISYAVTQRTHEIGLRMALGAQRRDVLTLVLSQGIKLAVVGVALGLTGALALTRVMEALLFNVSATDPLTFVVIAFLLTGVSLLACLAPARRATKVDPMIALRYE